MSSERTLSDRIVSFVERLADAVGDEVRRTRRTIVAPELRPRVENPIFVIGVHRSGTTLLRLILDSHSRIACPPESFFLLSLSRVLEDAKSMEGLAAMGFDRKHVAGQLRALVSYFFEMYASSKGKVRWADKTPSYVDCLDFIETLYGPGCRYVMIYRHGLDSASSIVKINIRDFDRHLASCGGDRHAAAARHWAHQCQKMVAFQRAHSERCFELRYEQLARDPEPVLRELFAFLDEPWEPAVLRFHEQTHDNWVRLQDRQAGQSRGFKPSIGTYRSQPPEVVRRMHEQAAAMLEALGYDTDESVLASASERSTGATPGC
ncbi:MAG: sulfotransferase [Myxococcota bacterium]|nr:sulfotransferase [Myxococcota bacterium]